MVKRRRRQRRTIQSGHTWAASKKQTKQPDPDLEYKKMIIRQRTLVLLILAVVAVLLALIFIGEPSLWVVVAVIIILTVLMLVVIGAPHLLPNILREIGRFFDR